MPAANLMPSSVDNGKVFLQTIQPTRHTRRSANFDPDHGLANYISRYDPKQEDKVQERREPSAQSG